MLVSEPVETVEGANLSSLEMGVSQLFISPTLGRKIGMQGVRSNPDDLLDAEGIVRHAIKAFLEV
jgi:hypothetical protein